MIDKYSDSKKIQLLIDVSGQYEIDKIQSVFSQFSKYVDLIKFTNSSRTYEYTETLIKNNEVLEQILGVFNPK